MTRKDYEKIAAVIEQARGTASVMRCANRTRGLAYDLAANDIANDLARLFELENPRFDRARFLRACGLDG